MTTRPADPRRITGSPSKELAQNDGESTPRSHRDSTRTRAEQVRKKQAALKLLAGWKTDESAYDEAAWPTLKKALEANRLSLR